MFSAVGTSDLHTALSRSSSVQTATSKSVLAQSRPQRLCVRARAEGPRPVKGLGKGVNKGRQALSASYREVNAASAEFIKEEDPDVKTEENGSSKTASYREDETTTEEEKKASGSSDVSKEAVNVPEASDVKVTSEGVAKLEGALKAKDAEKSTDGAKTAKATTEVVADEKEKPTEAVKAAPKKVEKKPEAKKVEKKEEKLEKKVAAEVKKQEEEVSYGEQLEQGWSARGNGSSFSRNLEVWKFALLCVRRVLKANKGLPIDRVEAAEYIRDGLLQLGPTFVKLGQVVSTRTDVLAPEYIEVLKTLQDDVPGFSGSRAKEIVSAELGQPCDEVFSNFSPEPLAAASLGQVHTAMYKGKKVAIKVQRAGLKELFDVDLKNLKKLATLLDKFDPKSDGADREWGSIYDESAKLLYKEIDYLNEAKNAERFKEDFKGKDWVIVPDVIYEVSTPRVLCMEFVESFKLTDLDKVDRLGLDRKLLAKRTADSFLRQIVETGYFHCDPHPGNLCVNTKGQLVFYDYGMMDELKPNVREGFRQFCIAVFDGGPFIDDLTLSQNAKKLVVALEKMGVLAKGADRLATEKLARFFIRNFKNVQMGKKGSNIKSTIGTDLLTLTDNKGGTVFRFPSTFTFIFRAFASVDGIGKGLDEEFNIGKLAQPFIEVFASTTQYSSEAQKYVSRFGKLTGLNLKDVNTAVTTPKKVAYIEETLREIEQGNLKIRTRSLENETALDRMALKMDIMENIMFASLLLTAGLAAEIAIVTGLLYGGAGLMAFKALMSMAKVKKFDKKQAKYVEQAYEEDDDDYMD
eukprot:CAMPEP_0197857120 /NCGR_PEP_ID=MMETSP1438-20131217/29897_1 /TAXON_ID=1461541 /ORGANISM="Pterosperma sp., Strain CCMP1384" /LENGTH=803 /DNA_ID=CAMNT_0043472829 /DNA_START=154 /DNA_END=2565 /DNA_ORIENTATION=+